MDISVLAFRHFAREIRQTPRLKSIFDIGLIEPDGFNGTGIVGNKAFGDVEIPAMPGAATLDFFHLPPDGRFLIGD